jgi:hypothetical protein
MIHLRSPTFGIRSVRRSPCPGVVSAGWMFDLDDLGAIPPQQMSAHLSHSHNRPITLFPPFSSPHFPSLSTDGGQSTHPKSPSICVQYGYTENISISILLLKTLLPNPSSDPDKIDRTYPCEHPRHIQHTNPRQGSSIGLSLRRRGQGASCTYMYSRDGVARCYRPCGADELVGGSAWCHCV